VEEGDLNTIFYRAITDVETCWLSTYLAWERLIILKPFIDIVISSLNASKDQNSKEEIYLKFWNRNIRRYEICNNELYLSRYC
jgi:hypothetical protein